VRRATLDASLDTPAKVHARLARDLDLPAHFGSNLDALWDCLARDVEGPFEIVWLEAEHSRALLGDTFGRFEALFRELETERVDFNFRLER
jgi:ribonuclease inhibitor